MNCQKCNRNFSEKGFIAHKQFCDIKTEDVEAIKSLYLSGLSFRKITAKGYKKKVIKFAVKDIVRTISTACKLAHKLYPESFKHSYESKLKISKAKSLFYKNNPKAATSWRQSCMSYPEKLFQNLVEKNELAKKYDIVREYSFFPFFIDFAFVNIKLAVEIDGSQHWKKQSKIESDKKKDELLISNDWKIYRIPEFLIKKQFEQVEKDLLIYLQTFDEQPKLFTFSKKIIEYEELKKYKKLQRQQLRQLSNNSREQLKQQWLIRRLNDVKQVGKQRGYVSELSKLWNVSHSQVRRFLLKYT